MTTHELIAALRRGAPVTPKMSGRIVERLVAGEWAMRSLADALDKHKGGKLTLTKDETGYVDGALEECERLKEAVRWEIECADGVSENGWGFWLGDDASEELCATYNAAWRDVEGLL